MKRPKPLLRAKPGSLVYLSSPYAHPEPEVREHRAEMAQRAAATLMQAGYVVFSPIAHTHGIEPYLESINRHNWGFWRQQDLPLLKLFDVVAILAIDGYACSEGVQAEILEGLLSMISVQELDPEVVCGRS